MSLIIFLSFLGLLILLLFGASGLYIAGQRRVNLVVGFCLGFFLSAIGLLILLIIKPQKINVPDKGKNKNLQKSS